MAVYEYQGLDDKGRKTSGLVDADSPRGARQKLRKQGVFPTSVKLGKAGAKNAAILAAQMLGLAHPEIAQAVTDLRAKQTAGVPEFPG